jgi:predicted protein tyrosine phosphatase
MEEPIDPMIVAEFFGHRILRLCFSDIPVASWKDYSGPDEADIRSALSFADHIRRECGADSTIAVHCAQGVSRSTSISLAIVAERLGPGKEVEAVRLLLASRADPSMPAELRDIQVAPNPGIVVMTDKLLNRKGAIHRALMDEAPRYVTWRSYWNRKLGTAAPWSPVGQAESS